MKKDIAAPRYGEGEDLLNVREREQRHLEEPRMNMTLNQAM